MQILNRNTERRIETIFCSGLKEKSGEEFKANLIEKKDWKILFLSVTEILNSHDTSKNRLYYSAPTVEGRKKLLETIKNEGGNAL
nr:CapA family protein [Treponema pedis]